MNISISMNTLIQAIYAVELSLDRYRQVMADEAENLTEEQEEEYGEQFMALTRAAGELGMIYEEERKKLPHEELPEFSAMTEKFIFL